MIDETSEARRVSRTTEPQAMRLKSIAKNSARLNAGLLSLRQFLPTCIVDSTSEGSEASGNVVFSFPGTVLRCYKLLLATALRGGSPPGVQHDPIKPSTVQAAFLVLLQHSVAEAAKPVHPRHQSSHGQRTEFSR